MFWVESMEINQLTFVLTFRLRELCGKSLLWRIKDIYDAISNAHGHPKTFLFHVEMDV